MCYIANFSISAYYIASTNTLTHSLTHTHTYTHIHTHIHTHTHTYTHIHTHTHTYTHIHTHTHAQASSLHFGDWGDGGDFDPAVKQACEAYKNASKNVYVISFHSYTLDFVKFIELALFFSTATSSHRCDQQR